MVKPALISLSEPGASHLKPLPQFSIWKMELKLPHCSEGEVLTGVLATLPLLLLYTIRHSPESSHSWLLTMTVLQLLLLFKGVSLVKKRETLG